VRVKIKYGPTRCCCVCVDGSVIPRLENVSLVRPPGDTGGPNYTVPPFPRYDSLQYDINNRCRDLPAGRCGAWLQGGDLNGVSSQTVQDTVPDIMPCGGAVDHNCYFANATVDMRNRRLGGQWVLAKKNWHGTFGFMDRVDPDVITGIGFVSGLIFPTDPETPPGGFSGNTTTRRTVAPQVKYLRVDIGPSGNGAMIEGYLHTDAGPLYTDFPIGATPYNNELRAVSVNRLTGILTSTGESVSTWTQGGIDYPAPPFTYPASESRAMASWTYNEVVNSFTAWKWDVTYYPLNQHYYTQQSGNTYTLRSGVLGDPRGEGVDRVLEEIEINLGGTFLRRYYGDTVFYTGGPWGVIKTESVEISNTSLVVSIRNSSWNTEGGDEYFVQRSYAISLSSPYTATDCLRDFYDALNEWDMSDFNLAKLRTDEKLALAPLCVYDEAGPTNTVQFPPLTMNDHVVGLVDDENGVPPGGEGYIETWAQRAWLDPNNYVWMYPNGSYTMPIGFVSGATLVTPMRTGAIISHTAAGSDRHFWYSYLKKMRVEQWNGGGFTGNYLWLASTIGDFSQSPLPEVTMRWMGNREAQYDAHAFTNNADPWVGNFPQSFLKQRNGVLVGAKYVESTQHWPSVNYGRPCGVDKYSVDQTTVCCVVSGTYVVKPTGEAINPLAAGGLAVGDTVAIDSTVAGIFQISSITDNSDGTWTVAVGEKIEDLPTGFTFYPPGSYQDGASHIGRLRFYSATACGIESEEASKRTGVFLQWTFDQRAAALPIEQRPRWLGGTTAGDGEGVLGCTGLTIEEFTYPAGACPAMVGTLPIFPVEWFDRQTVYEMPISFAFDDLYGAHWQSAVELVMPDPFWQRPFKPDCGLGENDHMHWTEDNGSGQADYFEKVGQISTIYTKHFPHRRWVEAASNIPTGKSLPAGVELFYAPGSVIWPPYYNLGVGGGGIPLANPHAEGDGFYADVERPWGFMLRACAEGNRFGRYYREFTRCV
jgi:hypothetical protein